MTTEPEPEQKYKTKRLVQNGVIRYQRIEATAEDLLEERDKEIMQLKRLVDDLRSKIETLEKEQQRKALRDAPVDSAESYNIYF